MKRLIIVGSPRTNGRSAHLAETLFEANIDEHPEDELFLVPVSEVDIGPCIGCDACRKKSGVILKGEGGEEVTVQKHRCVFDDDMQTLYDLIDDVDEVTVVSPVYFSGSPAPFKCVLDRLQPYYWARSELLGNSEKPPEKRSLTLHVIGEGGDPHGYHALVSEVNSAFSVAGFKLDRVLDWVGKIDGSGEITAEADEVIMGASGLSGKEDGVAGGGESGREGGGAPRQAPARKRAKLDLHTGIVDVPSQAGGTRRPEGEGRRGSGGKAAASAGGAQRQKAGKSKQEPGRSRQAGKGATDASRRKQGRRRGK